jgi:hypothetical protein
MNGRAARLGRCKENDSTKKDWHTSKSVSASTRGKAQVIGSQVNSNRTSELVTDCQRRSYVEFLGVMEIEKVGTLRGTLTFYAVSHCVPVALSCSIYIYMEDPRKTRHVGGMPWSFALHIHIIHRSRNASSIQEIETVNAPLQAVHTTVFSATASTET